MFGRKKKKDTRSYKNFEYWSIEKLREVLNENYCRGSQGHDYDRFKEEMSLVLWDKENKLFEEQTKKELANRF